MGNQTGNNKDKKLTYSFNQESYSNIKKFFEHQAQDIDSIQNDQFIRVFNKYQRIGQKLISFIQKIFEFKEQKCLSFNQYIIIIELIYSKYFFDEYNNQEYQKVKDWFDLDKLDLFVMILLEQYDIQSQINSQEVFQVLTDLLNICLMNENDFDQLIINTNNKDKCKALNSLHKSIMSDNESITISSLIRKLNSNVSNIDIFIQSQLLYCLTQDKQYLSKVLTLESPSDILSKEELLLLQLMNPSLSRPNTSIHQLDLLFSTNREGTSLNRLVKALLGYPCGTLLVIEHKQSTPVVSYSVLGAFHNLPWEDSLSYQGDSNDYLFSLSSVCRKFYPSGNHKRYAYLNTKAIHKSEHQPGLGFGGDGQFSNYRLWLDSDLQELSTIGNQDGTYQSGSLLCDYSQIALNVQSIEIWGLGGEQARKQQKNYREQTQQTLNSMRQVDKKAFMSGFDQSIMMGETFKHKQQARIDIDQEKLEHDL